MESWKRTDKHGNNMSKLHPRGLGGGGMEVTPGKLWVEGICGEFFETLTLFQTTICDVYLPYPISDRTAKFRPDVVFFADVVWVCHETLEERLCFA